MAATVVALAHLARAGALRGRRPRRRLRLPRDARPRVLGRCTRRPATRASRRRVHGRDPQAPTELRRARRRRHRARSRGAAPSAHRPSARCRPARRVAAGRHDRSAARAEPARPEGGARRPPARARAREPYQARPARARPRHRRRHLRASQRAGRTRPGAQHLGANIADASLHALPTPDRGVLARRLARHARNAGVLARGLQAAAPPAISVAHPALPAHPGHARRPATWLTLLLPTAMQARAFIDAALRHARAHDVALVEGASFGLDTTRIYAPSPGQDPQIGSSASAPGSSTAQSSPASRARWPTRSGEPERWHKRRGAALAAVRSARRTCRIRTDCRRR